MENSIGKATAAPAMKVARAFNINKLQAVACMMASVAVSTGLIIWAMKALF